MNPSPLPMRLLRHWPILLLGVWFFGMTVLLDRSAALLSERTTPDPAQLQAPAPWRAFRLFADPDSYAWLSYARDLRESPHFRVRFTHMDNAPHGRPVHWAQLPIWSLCAIATALETFGIPSPDSLELAGRILLPLLGFLFFSALWLVLRRRVPPVLAALVVLSAAVTHFWNFHPLRPDHHGFHIAAAFAFALPLLFSSFGFAPSSRRNGLPFLLSGLFGGVALWLGATVFYFTLASAGLASALAILPRYSSPALTRHSSLVTPESWRLWGLSGFSAALFFYLLEYAPAHFSIRLEANHPLYALSFLGIGECLCLLMRFRHQNQRLSPAVLFHATLALAAAAALPALVLFGPVDWYIPRSTLMLRLHARHISEFLPLRALCAVQGHSYLRMLLLPVLPALPALVALPFIRSPWPRRLRFALAFFGVFLLLYHLQTRWDAFAAVAASLLLLAVASVPAPRAVFRFLPHAALILQLVFGLHHNLRTLPALLRGRSSDPLSLFALQGLATATQFRSALSNPDVTPTPNASSPAILAPPELAPVLWYAARIPSVASLYWENLPGNAAAAAAFADTSPDALSAAAIVRERRISHLFMFEDAQTAVFFDDLHSGIHDPRHAAQTLAGTLAGAIPDKPLPPWLAVDTDLNRLANPILYTLIPPQHSLSPSRLPLRIYSLMPP